MFYLYKTNIKYIKAYGIFITVKSLYLLYQMCEPDCVFILHEALIRDVGSKGAPLEEPGVWEHMNRKVESLGAH